MKLKNVTPPPYPTPTPTLTHPTDPSPSSTSAQPTETNSTLPLAKPKSTHKCVKDQLNVYKSLLNFRIQLQQVLNTLHKLPIPPLNITSYETTQNVKFEDSLTYTSFDFLKDFIDVVTGIDNKTKQNGTQIEDVMGKNGTNTKKNKKRNLALIEDEIIIQKGSLWAERMCEWAENCTQNEFQVWELLDKPMNKIKLNCLQKLDTLKENTQLKKYQTFQVLDQPPSTQVINSMKDEEKWTERIKPKLDTSELIGINQNDVNFDKYLEILKQNIYSDNDFYVSLLKETIQLRSSMSGEDALKNHLNSKNKTKNQNEERHTSKGRKLYFTPIPQLQNFMAAKQGYITYNNSTDDLNNSNLIDQMMLSLFKDN